MSAEELARKLAQRLRIRLGGEFRDWDGVVASEIKPYAVLLLDLREVAKRTEHEPMCDYWTRGSCDCAIPLVLAKADELLT